MTQIWEAIKAEYCRIFGHRWRPSAPANVITLFVVCTRCGKNDRLRLEGDPL